MAASNEYVIDGEAVNKQLEAYQLTSYQPTSQLHHLLPGQVFEIIEKKYLKGLLDEIDKVKPKSVKFVNLEAIASGSQKDYLQAICGGLRVLIDSLTAKNITVIGTIVNPWVLPWDLVAKIDSNFKGLPAPGESTPP